MGNREGGSRGARGEGARGEGARGPFTPAEIEEAISRIPGVRAVRVVLGPGPRITEVHVLASQERGAKQIVRDVQSALVAAFGLDIDYRIISVVQLTDEDQAARSTSAPGPETPAAPSRPALSRIASESDGLLVAVTVEVSHQGASAQGSARGTATSAPKIVAQATVDAVSKLIGEVAVDVDAADVVAEGPYRLAVVVLKLVGARGEHVVSGSAIVRRDATDAVARATLDALNRLIRGT